jgi:demethylmenaquinone methyltransferase / 2-methoxy-6-polyprenyl-1,4-benzoquinol methylase
VSDLSHSFGNRTVDPRERERQVRETFRRIARRYDLLNDIMSLGMHRLGKRSLVRAVGAAPGAVIVDLAGGTGDIAHQLAGHDRRVIVIDPSFEMMSAGYTRRHHALRWVAGTAEQLPLPDASIDCVTISFGIRNFTHIEGALVEILRVLKPGGQLWCLEFSEVIRPLRGPVALFNCVIIPLMGALLAGDRSAYRYLVESIARFPNQEDFADILRQAGFTGVGYRNFGLGVAALHFGTRPV